MEPIILTIQTAVPAGSLALTSGEKLLAEINLDIPGTPTEWLLPAIEDLLRKTGLAMGRVDAVAVVKGPGSFTGLRVGLATAKGLAMAAGCPMLGVSSLRSLAMQTPFAGMPVCALIDARKKEVYTACYTWEAGRPKAVSQERVVAPEKLLDELAGEVLFVGGGATVYKTLIVRRMANRAHFVPAVMNHPRAGTAALLALAEWESGNRLAPQELLPEYLRPSEAELNWQERQKSGNSC